MNKLSAQVEYISPKKAQLYLQYNGVNRPIRNGKVSVMVSDIKNGAWELNGEPICFTENGKLSDGQHRLSAIVLSGKTVPVLVVRGIKNDVTVYDRGTNRTEADSLILSGMSKEIANNRIVAIVKLHYRVQTGTKGSVPLNFIKDFITENAEELTDIIKISSKNAKHKSTGGIIATRSAVLTLPGFYAYKTGADKTRLSRFYEVVSNGFYDSNEHESSAIVLRNDLLSRYIDTNNNRDPQSKSILVVEKALHDFLNRKDRKQSYINAGVAIYSNNECFKVDKKYLVGGANNGR